MIGSLRGWWTRKAASNQEVRAEARRLVASKGRAGALFDLTERRQAVGLSAIERRRLAKVIAAVQMLTARPPKADLATRMLYRD